MQRLFWWKLVLIVVGIVAVSQVLYFVVSHRLEERYHIHTEVRVLSKENEAELAFESLVQSVDDNRILDASGEYQLVPFLATATHQPAYQPLSSVPDIALVTQGSLSHLYNLVPLVKFWNGPVSVAIFAQDHEISDALWRIAGLRICHPSIIQNVTFHLVSTLSVGRRSPLSVPKKPPPTCKLENSAETGPNNYAGLKKFPNNVLRNLARKGTASEFILMMDIDLIPSSNLRKDFYNFAIKNHLFGKSKREDKIVYVLPAYESESMTLEPQNKQKLLKLTATGNARPFYLEICPDCQGRTNFDKWQKALPRKGISSLFEVLWKDPWEPFYISRNSAPFYDERFKQFGLDRISQVCELHVAGFKFSVLNNGFLIHKGLKTRKSFHKTMAAEQKSNLILFGQFKAELKFKYPKSSKRC